MTIHHNGRKYHLWKARAHSGLFITLYGEGRTIGKFIAKDEETAIQKAHELLQRIRSD